MFEENNERIITCQCPGAGGGGLPAAAGPEFLRHAG
jgi:hypothetical protein